MASSISIGTTGLTASSKQMDVIANNLANSNTLGYKAGNTYFASMLNQSLSSSGSMAVGQGVGVAAALSAQRGVAPRALPARDLQGELLRQGVYLGDTQRLRALGVA